MVELHLQHADLLGISAVDLPMGDAMTDARCWNVWRADVGDRWALDTRGSSRDFATAIMRSLNWNRLGVPSDVLPAGVNPNELERDPVEVETQAGVSADAVPRHLRH